MNGLVRASLWTGTAASWVDLTPAGASDSLAFGTSGTQQVGYSDIAGLQRANLWSGTKSSWVDLHPASSTGSIAFAASGAQQVGTVHFGDEFDYRASLWTGTAASWVDLSPSGSQSSDAYGTSGMQQVGSAVGLDGWSHASLWSGTAESWEDLHLALTGSWKYSIAKSMWNDGSYVYVSGFAFNYETNRHEALLWARPISWPMTDLNPDGATESSSLGAAGAQQVGQASIGGIFRASLWSGTPASRIDLHPAASTASYAFGISTAQQIAHQRGRI